VPRHTVVRLRCRRSRYEPVVDIASVSARRTQSRMVGAPVVERRAGCLTVGETARLPSCPTANQRRRIRAMAARSSENRCPRGLRRNTSQSVVSLTELTFGARSEQHGRVRNASAPVCGPAAARGYGVHDVPRRHRGQSRPSLLLLRQMVLARGHDPTCKLQRGRAGRRTCAQPGNAVRSTGSSNTDLPPPPQVPRR